jgi:hypothetical protein
VRAALRVVSAQHDRHPIDIVSSLWIAVGSRRIPFMWYYRSSYTVNGVHEITFTKYSEPWWFARYQTKSTFENKVRLYQTMPAHPIALSLAHTLCASCLFLQCSV